MKEIVQNVRTRTRLRRMSSAFDCLNNASASAIAEADNSFPAAAPVGDEAEKSAIDKLNAISNPSENYIKNDEDLHRPPKRTAWARETTQLFPTDETRLQVYAAPYLADDEASMKASANLNKVLIDDKMGGAQKLEARYRLNKSPYGKLLNQEAQEQGDDSDVEDDGVNNEVSFGKGYLLREVKRVAIFESILQFEANRFKEAQRFLADELGITVVEVCKYFSNALYRKAKWVEKERHDGAVKDHRRNLLQWISESERTPTVDVMQNNSVDYFSCRRGNIFDCTMHGCGVISKPKRIPYDMTRKRIWN